MKPPMACLGLVLLAPPAAAQAPFPLYLPGPTLGIQQNNTGGRPDIVVSRGATGADTITSDSAAGGNASRPELRIPNGSASGGNGR